MPNVPLHPAIVHIPLGLAFVLPLVVLVLTVLLWRGQLARRAFISVFALQLVLFASGLAALKTGENDEERVERVVAESRIEQHEEAAELFVWGAGAVLVLSLAPLLLRSRRGQSIAAALATASTFAVAGLGYRAGKAGGELVYVHGAAQAYTQTGSAGSAPSGEAAPARHGHDDDD